MQPSVAARSALSVSTCNSKGSSLSSKQRVTGSSPVRGATDFPDSQKESLGLKQVGLPQDSTPAGRQARASSPVRGATELHGSTRFFRFRNTATDRVSPSRCRIVPFAAVDGVCETHTSELSQIFFGVLYAHSNSHTDDEFDPGRVHEHFAQVGRRGFSTKKPVAGDGPCGDTRWYNSKV